MFSTPAGLRACSPYLNCLSFLLQLFYSISWFLDTTFINSTALKTFMQCYTLRCFSDKFSQASYNISTILSTILSFLYHLSHIWL